MKKSSNVLLSAVFMTTAASFMADKAKAQQSLSNISPMSSDRALEQDSLSHHNVIPPATHRGFFSRLFHHSPKPTTNTNGNGNTVNDGPRKTVQTMNAVAAAPKSSGGFGGTGSGSAHS